MNTQIYLLLARKAGDFSMGGAAMWAKQVLKDMILGDSLDTPFLKFIRVQGVDHSISFPGSKTTVVRNGANARVYKTAGHDEEAGDYNQNRLTQRQRRLFVQERETTRWGTTRVRAVGRQWGDRREGALGHVKFLSTFRNNQYIAPALPKQGSFSFTKFPDNSTPQLAYGCSAQEPMAFAGFFFRRRIGAGIMGVRLPFMMIGLRKCLITGWKLNDDFTETVTMSYKDIIWSTFDQLADINVPTGMSSRIWQADTKEGGEKKEAYIGQALIAALTVIAGGAVALTGAGDGVKKG